MASPSAAPRPHIAAGPRSSPPSSRLAGPAPPRSRRAGRLVRGLLAAVAFAGGCGDEPVDPPRAATVTVSPASATLQALDATVRLTARVLDQYGAEMTGVAVAWSSRNTEVATVDAAGLVTAVGNGTAAVTASVGSVSGSAQVTVAQRAAEIRVSPGAHTLAALEDTVRLSAEAFDANGHVVAAAEFTWSSGADSVAAVDAAGLVTAVGNGTAVVAAAVDQVAGTADVTVEQAAAAVVVTPAAASLVVADTLRFSARAVDANNHAVEGAAAFAWASGDTLVALVDDAGLATGVAPGEAAVTATSQGLTGRATLIVAAAVATSVEVTPDTVIFSALGQTERLEARVLDQSGGVMEGAAVSWMSGDTLVAGVDPAAGLVTAAANGTAEITATAGDAVGAATAIVMQSADSVAVSPSANIVAQGDTVRLAAEAFDANGHRIEAAAYEWSSSDVSVARVDGTGLVRGVAEGGATIAAAADDAEGTALVTVEHPDRVALAALYRATDGPNWVNSDGWLTDSPLGEWHGVETGASGRVTGITLGDNGLSGPLPAELGNLAELRSLALHGNAITGPIPPQLGRLAALETLWLPGNRLSDSIPPELGNLTNLTWLDLSINDLSGPIPPELGGLANLTFLNLGVNNLSGPVPPELGGLANLAFLKLNRNRLSGPIPSEFGNLAGLNSLDLGANELSGPVPADLGRLEALSTVILADNELSGPIPGELGDVAGLRLLWLGANDLSGPIPQSFLNLDLDGFGVAYNARLCLPGTAAFLEWMRAIEDRRDAGLGRCNAADVAALTRLHEAAGGGDWTESAGWTVEEAVEDWHGVTADTLGRVAVLDLTDNRLAGRLPTVVGDLDHLVELRIADNAGLAGRLPLGLASVPLHTLHYSGTGLCVPGDPSFREWLDSIGSHEGTGDDCAALSNRDALVALYDATGGPEWTNRRNWLTDAPLGRWHGVETDDDGRVSVLALGRNNLTGRLPPEIGGLRDLRVLVIEENSLAGPLPPELGDLSGLDSLWGYASGGPGGLGRLPPELGKLSNLKLLSLGKSGLSGSLPAEVSGLSSLNAFWAHENDLTGAIPPELGRLANLEVLYLPGNALTGGIPPEFGRLSDLWWLDLSRNALTDAIPPELGRLAGLRFLNLSNNALTGAVPPELEGLSTLQALNLDHNSLSGPAPPELGELASLENLGLTNNAAMTGALPLRLTALRNLTTLAAGGTGLCAPSDPAFVEWFEGVPQRRVAACDAEPAMAYLVQSVQSREFPVPLVANQPALLRVFVTAGESTSEGMPLVRARFYRNDRQVHSVDIPGTSTPIPTRVHEGSLLRSANVDIPAGVVEPGLEMVIEVDPEGALDPDLGVARRIPETGRLAVDVRRMPRLDLTLVPFLWTQDPDSSAIREVASAADDPDGHPSFSRTRTFLPVGDFEVSAHAPVLSSSNSAYHVLAQTEVVHVLEGGTGHYMGTMAGDVTGPAGIAALGGRVSFSLIPGPTLHELGHNLNLLHAPCGGAAGPDPSFPTTDASIGGWGWDAVAEELVDPDFKDIMSYCGPGWISDYHFTNALRYRLIDEGSPSARVRSLLLWGGIDAEGAPSLEPAFVVDGAPRLPDSAGAHRLTGRAADGRILFSLSFAATETADGDGRSSFVFAVPVRSDWAGKLARVTLTGPGGSDTLDTDSNRPVTILRDPRTGRVRAFLRGPPGAAEAQAGAVLGFAPRTRGWEVLVSRGIPGSDAWRR